MERSDRMCMQCRHDIDAHDAETDMCNMHSGTPSACPCAGFQRTLPLAGPVKMGETLKVEMKKQDVTLTEVFPRRVQVAFLFDPATTICVTCEHTAALHYETLSGATGCRWQNQPNDNECVCTQFQLILRVTYVPSEGCKLV